ncbi:MAG: lipopolysaccharide kinase InaA family protein [Marinilabilia sp.]
MQKVVYHTNTPDFKHIMLNLPEVFAKEGTTIKDGRNEIKVIEKGGMRFCVKYFKKVSRVNLLVYSWFRHTKAKRSYQTAEMLLRLDVGTPFPIGYAEVKDKWGIVRQSYYVSLCQDYDWLLSDALDGGIPEEKDILSAYAQFMALKVHPAGIWHKDMTPGNVLINRKNDHYTFALVDLNRIRIKNRISPSQGIRNMKRLKGGTMQLAYVAEQYALAAKEDPKNFIFRFFGHQLAFLNKRRKTKKILHALDPTRKAIR